MEGPLDIGHPSGQVSVAFDMPNKNPEKTRQLKHEWYVRNKERVLQQKRERRAALKKLKPPQTAQTSPHTRTGGESPRGEPTGLSPLPSQAFGPSASPQPGLLPPELRANCTATAGPSCPGSAESTDSQSVPNVACVGGRVCRPIFGARARICQDQADPGPSGPMRKNKNKNCIGSESMPP